MIARFELWDLGELKRGGYSTSADTLGPEPEETRQGSCLEICPGSGWLWLGAGSLGQCKACRPRRGASAIKASRHIPDEKGLRG